MAQNDKAEFLQALAKAPIHVCKACGSRYFTRLFMIKHVKKEGKPDQIVQVPHGMICASCKITFSPDFPVLPNTEGAARMGFKDMAEAEVKKPTTEEEKK